MTTSPTCAPMMRRERSQPLPQSPLHYSRHTSRPRLCVLGETHLYTRKFPLGFGSLPDRTWPSPPHPPPRQLTDSSRGRVHGPAEVSQDRGCDYGSNQNDRHLPSHVRSSCGLSGLVLRPALLYCAYRHREGPHLHPRLPEHHLLFQPRQISVRWFAPQTCRSTESCRTRGPAAAARPGVALAPAHKVSGQRQIPRASSTCCSS